MHGVDKNARERRASAPFWRPMLRRIVWLRFAGLMLGAAVYGNVHAEQRQTVWRNASSFAPYTLTRTSQSGCVTNAGPETFDVKPRGSYGLQITVGGNCLASVSWRLTQRRPYPHDDLDVSIYYIEAYDDEAGMVAYFSVKFDKPANGKAMDYFRANCGPALSASPSCLGSPVSLTPPTSKNYIVFNVLAIPVHLMKFGGMYAQPM